MSPISKFRHITLNGDWKENTSNGTTTDAVIPRLHRRGEQVETFDLIRRSQTGDGNATLALVQKFNPLLKKYAKELSYEDALNDLTLDFLELLHNINLDRIRIREEKGIVAYVSSAVHSYYIKRLSTVIEQQNIRTFSELSEDEQHYVESISGSDNSFAESEFRSILATLTILESQVITSLYYAGYTVTETAEKQKVSRQAVNKTKIRAIKKLRTSLEDNKENKE